MSRDYRVSNIYYMLAYAFDNNNLIEKRIRILMLKNLTMYMIYYQSFYVYC